MQLSFEIPDYWPKLIKGDDISLISPSFALKPGEIASIKDLLTDWGLRPQIFPCKTPNHEAFLANSDEERLSELQKTFSCDNSKVIAANRGGYGAARILNDLLEGKKPQKFKLLCGFSDITSLHLAFNNCFKFSTLHCPVLKDIANGRINNKSIQLFKDILFGKIKILSYEVRPLNPALKIVNLPKLLGGNLSLIQTSIGTKWQINNNGEYAMLIEDVDEEAYKIDRMLNHLKNANIFNNCRAIFIGDFTEKADRNNQYHLNQIINEFISQIKIPAFEIRNIGHGTTNLSIPLGIAPTFKIL